MPRRSFDRLFSSGQALRQTRGTAPGRTLPPPEHVTAADICHVALGLLMIPLGVIILARTVSIAVTVHGVLTGGAFVTFGAYRLWTAWSRYRLYRQTKRGSAR